MWDKIKRFLFASVYEVITWVWIGVSIGAYFYNAANKNAGGVRLAEISLAVSVFAMLCFIAKRIFWDEQEKPSERPELSLEMAKVVFRPNQSAMVRLYIRNRGNVTA